MKTIAISAVAALALGASFAADEPPTTPAEKTAAVEKRTAKTLKVSDVAKDKKLTPEEREAKIAEMKRKQQERIEARRKAIEARVAAAEEAAAKEKGITVEELRRQRAAERAKIAPKVKELKRRMEAAERKIDKLQQALDEASAELFNPTPQTDFAEANRKVRTLQFEIDRYTADWEEAATELEALSSGD